MFYSLGKFQLHNTIYQLCYYTSYIIIYTNYIWQLYNIIYQLCAVLSHSVVPDSLRPHGL